MTSLIHFRHFSLAVFAACTFAGCSNTKYPNDLPKLHSCTITITQENVPLANANVFLIPADGIKWNAGGTTDSGGKVVLYTHGKYKGVPLGTYKVTVNKYEIGPEKPNGEATLAKTGNFPVPDAFSFVDLQYTAQNKTPLEVTVTKKNRSFHFDVGSPVHILIPK
ncbi:MAG: carboxypeptidase-like regulatory domain-containing protein [Planctomycetaceae bacterium]|jgi:hypothetical protein|nr:carboxypeptidase-like regulatory domain-containing protein [Planctomycetaceae bacterium]